MSCCDWDGTCPHGHTAENHPKPPRSQTIHADDMTDDEAREMLDNLLIMEASGGGCQSAKDQRKRLIAKLQKQLGQDNG